MKRRHHFDDAQQKMTPLLPFGFCDRLEVYPAHKQEYPSAFPSISAQACVVTLTFKLDIRSFD
jgi:hypothetical protein